MRDKFIFEPNPVPASDLHAIRQLSIAQIFVAHKKSRKLLESIAHNRLALSLQVPGGLSEGNTHLALHEYEKTHLSIGNWPRLRGSLKLRWNKLDIREANGVAELHESIEGVNSCLGKIYLDHLRFVLVDPRPVDVQVDIYQRRGDNAGRHYIMVSAESPGRPPVFVRRYVVRGLNGHNSMDLDNAAPMKAAHVTRAVALPKAQPTEQDSKHPRRHPADNHTLLSEKQMLISHARGWKKRYVSTGVGSKAPLSTRGTVFVSLFGNVAVDLAKIDATKIFDLHAPVSANLNLSIDPQLVMTQGASYPATDYQGEEYLGLRDVLRTRELVIKGEVPLNAVVKTIGEKKILGLGFTDKAAGERLKTALNTAGADLDIPAPVNKELEDFVWSDSKRWFFLLYTSAGECAEAARAAGVSFAGQATVKQINVYTFAPPLGMVTT